MSKILAAFVALLKAIPALESLIRQVIAQRDKAREATALERKTSKDSAVDEAIDRPLDS